MQLCFTDIIAEFQIKMAKLLLEQIQLLPLRKNKNPVNSFNTVQE